MKISYRIFCFFVIFSNSILYADVLINESKPFNYPQTTLVGGEINYKFKAKNKDLDFSWEKKSKKLNAYGFDIETPYNAYTNIGFYFRFDYFNDTAVEDGSLKFETRLATFLGLFGRLQYAPFESRILNFFTRADLGFGPTIMKFSGVSLQGAVHLGVESYLSDWLGFSVSYVFLQEVGKETILGSLEGSDAVFKNIVVYTSGRAVMFGVKTTYF